MPSRKDRSQYGAYWLRRYWVLLAVAALVAVVSLAGQPLFAADAQPAINQTVPPPTPRPEVTDPGNNDDNNDDNNSGSPATEQQPAATLEPSSATGQTAEQTAVVNVLALNVRQGPGTDFPVIGKLVQGDAVVVEARNTDGDWLLVCCIAGTETRGWVSAGLIAPNFGPEQAAALPVSDSAVAAAPLATTAVPTTTSAATATTPVTTTTLVPGSQPGTVAGVNLNVRSGPGTDNAVVAKLRAGDIVSVLGRNAAGDWLNICCVGTPAGNGWVSAEFITPAFAAADLEEVTVATQTAAPAATSAAAPGPAAAADSAAGLTVVIAQQPPFAVQGKEVSLVYTVRNNGSTDLADVVLRSELPGPLTLVGATAGGGTVTQDQAPVVEITWPALAAGESATATVRVRVADDVPNGATFANLASVSAGDESASSGITIGMPPSLLPEFW